MISGGSDKILHLSVPIPEQRQVHLLSCVSRRHNFEKHPLARRPSVRGRNPSLVINAMISAIPPISPISDGSITLFPVASRVKLDGLAFRRKTACPGSPSRFVRAVLQ